MGLFDGFFGGLFDFDGDGATSDTEGFLGLAMLEGVFSDCDETEDMDDMLDEDDDFC